MSVPSRLPVILAGYLAAVVVASVIVISPFWLSDPTAPGLILFLAVALAVAALVSLLPALLVSIHAERTKVRGLWFYLLWGLTVGGVGLVVMLGLVLAAGGNFSGGGSFVATAALIMAAAGSAAGFTYWAIAGRTAGMARKVPEA